MDFVLIIILPFYSAEIAENKFEFKQEFAEWFGVRSPQGPLEGLHTSSGITITKLNAELVSNNDFLKKISMDWNGIELASYELRGGSASLLPRCKFDSENWSKAFRETCFVIERFLFGLDLWAVLHFNNDYTEHLEVLVNSWEDARAHLKQSFNDGVNLIEMFRNK